MAVGVLASKSGGTAGVALEATVASELSETQKDKLCGTPLSVESHKV